MSDLKSDWKKTGKGIGDAFNSIGDEKVNTGASFGSAFKNLGKSIIKSAKVGIEKADQWATEDDNKEGEQAAAEATETEAAENSEEPQA